MHTALCDTAVRNRLNMALSAGYAAGMRYLDGRLQGGAPTGPFTLALYDLTGFSLHPQDFPNTPRVIDYMRDRRVTMFGMPGYDHPLGGERYGNLSTLTITAVKAAEVGAAAVGNLDLLNGRSKWPGACAAFGGQPESYELPGRPRLDLALVGSGFLAEVDLTIIKMTTGPVFFELAATGVVPTAAITSPTFILGPKETWSYPDAGTV